MTIHRRKHNGEPSGHLISADKLDEPIHPDLDDYEMTDKVRLMTAKEINDRIRMLSPDERVTILRFIYEWSERRKKLR